MAGMPFSPCDGTSSGADCNDKSVQMLHDIFGDIIYSLATGSDPNSVDASSNILATMFSFFNSGVLIVGSLIVSYVAIMGVANTANDGEAMGKSWSSLWTPVRIVAGGAVLLPTASGYSFIQIIILMFSLWGVGFANSIYSAGMTMGILSPNGIVDGVNQPGSFYGLREFGKQYMAASYCAKAANSIYSESGNTPEVRTKSASGSSGAADKTTFIDGRTEKIFFLKDRNSVTNLGGGQAFCGTIKIADYVAQNRAGANDTERVLEQLRVQVQAEKVTAAYGIMSDIDAWVREWPVTINDAGWNQVNSNKFNEIINKWEQQVATQIAGQVHGKKSDVDGGINAFVEVLTQEGWASAGGWFQRVGMVRGQINNILTENVGSVSQPSMLALPWESRAFALMNSVETVTSLINKKAEEKGSYQQAAVKPEDLSSMIPKNIKGGIDTGELKADMDAKMSSMVNNMMLNIVNLVIGKGDLGAMTPFCGTTGQMGGSLSRMKCVGDYLAVMSTTITIADITIKSAVSAARVAAGIASGGKILGTGFDAAQVGVPVWDWIMEVPIKLLDKILRHVDPLAFYFGVFLPSLPYCIFMVVVVGWILAVLQSTIASTLWAVMHMTPGKTFVGSQTQGYLLILALFVRPALAVIGLFAAVLVSDPIIDYTAEGFFSMRGAIVTSTGVIGVIAEFMTFSWWMMVFGFTLLPILYMCFGLPQILPDHVLRWIGAGIGDLGETNAIGQMRGQMAAVSLA